MITRAQNILAESFMDDVIADEAKKQVIKTQELKLNIQIPLTLTVTEFERDGVKTWEIDFDDEAVNDVFTPQVRKAVEKLIKQPLQDGTGLRIISVVKQFEPK